MQVKCFDRILDLSEPKVMGILNVTSDSFYDGGRYTEMSTIQDRISQLIEEGADIIDIGGMSTRPGAQLITAKKEIERVLPAIKHAKYVYPDVFLSIDTIYGETSEVAIKEGVDIINDISAFAIDDNMLKTLAKYKPAYVLMHNRGRPDNMTKLTDYEDLIHEIGVFFVNKLNRLKEIGVEEVILDPGFGFSKNIDQNYLLLSNLSSFRFLGKPILSGLSRKSMFYKYLEVKPDDTLLATQIGNYESLQQGAKILRVHDVAEAKQTIRLWQKMNPR